MDHPIPNCVIILFTSSKFKKYIIYIYNKKKMKIYFYYTIVQISYSVAGGVSQKLVTLVDTQDSIGVSCHVTAIRPIGLSSRTSNNRSAYNKHNAGKPPTLSKSGIKMFNYNSFCNIICFSSRMHKCKF
jgi:hypothetical protein